jgi:hypothetical protein
LDLLVNLDCLVILAKMVELEFLGNLETLAYRDLVVMIVDTVLMVFLERKVITVLLELMDILVLLALLALLA